MIMHSTSYLRIKHMKRSDQSAEISDMLVAYQESGLCIYKC